jgi:hypothetical protein
VENQEVNNRTRRELLSIEALDPLTGQRSLVYSLDYKKIQYIGKRSLGQLHETAEIVPFILQSPRSIFEGLCWDQDEKGSRGVGWRCYCGLPELAYREDGIQIEPYHEEVCLVFVDDENIVYNWRWEKSDRADKGLPNEFDIQHGQGKRFKQRLL